MPNFAPRATVLPALTALGLLAAAGVLPACGSGGPTRPAAADTGPIPEFSVDHNAWNELGYRWEWTTRPPTTRDGVIAFADAYEDLLVIQDTGAMVSVIEAPTGRVRWNRQAAQTNTRFLGNVRRDGSVVVTNETQLFEFDLRTGNTVDLTQINGIATTRPVFFGDKAVLATAEGRVVALDTRQNLRVWEYQFDGLIETPPLKIDENRVAGISTRGEIRVLDVGTARTISTGRISGDSGDWMVSDAEFLFIGSLDQSVYGYDMADGTRLWRLRSSAPVTIQPTLIGETLYVTTADTGLTAVDAISGEIRWKNTDLGGWVLTTQDGDLMVWTGGELLRVDAERGDLISRARFDALSGLRTDSQDEGDIYAISKDGAVARFSPR
jgi:outer membrane protein assembly factor BamB